MTDRILLLCALVVTAAACAGEPDRVEIVDKSDICLRSDAEPDPVTDVYSVQEGSQLVVTVMTCEACGSENNDLSCTIEQDGAALTVHTRYAFDDHHPDACTAECRFLEAECVTEPLAEGSYSVVYAAWEAPLDVDVPSSIPETCSN